MRTKTLNLFLLIAVILMNLISCKKDNGQNDAMVDAYVKSVFSDGEPVFGLVHYVNGYSEINAVTLQTPDDFTVQLSAFDNTKKFFYAEPSLLEGTYSSNVPVPGVYNYGVTFADGEQKVFTNTLSEEFLMPAEINSITKSVITQSVVMNWEPVTGVEYYQLEVLRDGIVVYKSNLFPPPTSNQIMLPLSYISSFYPGNYTFQLTAIAYETSDNVKVQAISISEIDIDL